MNDYILETFIENKNNYEEMHKSMIDNRTETTRMLE